MSDIERLANALPINSYGKGEAKSFHQLLDEINNGETTIKWMDNKPIRYLKLVFLTVRHQHKILIEDRQEFPDGRFRSRGIEGISEKLFPNEEHAKAVYRALQEELGYAPEELQGLSVKFLGQTLIKRESKSYPGLESHYETYNYEINLPDVLYKPEYIEVSQDGRKTYFSWKMPMS